MLLFFWLHSGESRYNPKRETQDIKKREAHNIPSISAVRLVTYVVYWLRLFFCFLI